MKLNLSSDKVFIWQVLMKAVKFLKKTKLLFIIVHSIDKSKLGF